MSERTHVVSYRYYILEPTKHRTRCAQCMGKVEGGVLYVIRLTWDNDEISEWFFACVSCYAEIESETMRANPSKKHLRFRGQENSLRLVTWNEEP